MAIRTKLADMFGLRHPVLLAPMARVSGGALAAAVTNAGGLGFIGGGYGDREWLAREYQRAGNTPVGVGFITWALKKNPDLLNVALDRKPPAIFLSFGDLGDFAMQVKQAGVRLIAQVQSVAQAKRAIEDGADAIIAQGTEAGGHGGQRATLPLVPAIVDAAGDIPVVAAGGIGDGRGLAASLMLGASGVLCGTAFYASEESLAHPNAKRAACAGSGDATRRGRIFDVVRNIDWPAQWNVRALENDFSQRWGDDVDSLRAAMDSESGPYAAAVDAGDMSIAATFVGEGVDLLAAIRPATEIVETISAEAYALLRAAPRFCG